MVVYLSLMCWSRLLLDFIGSHFLDFRFQYFKDFRKSIWDLKTVGDHWLVYISYTITHSRGKTFAVRQQYYQLCRENFCGLPTTTYFSMSVLIMKQENSCGKTSVISKNLWKLQTFSPWIFYRIIIRYIASKVLLCKYEQLLCISHVITLLTTVFHLALSYNLHVYNILLLGMCMYSQEVRWNG